jgi:formate hydrogenlyase subunit 4
MFLASFSAISFSFITIIPGKTIPLGILAILQPSVGFITGPRVSCFASFWPIFLGFDSGSIYSRLLLEYYSGWAFLFL